MWLRELEYCRRRRIQGREEEDHNLLVFCDKTLLFLSRKLIFVKIYIKVSRKGRCKLTDPFVMGF